MYQERIESTDSAKERKASSDEIDLNAIFSILGRMFSSIGKGIAYFKMVVLKRLIMLLTFVVVGIAIGWGIFYTTKPYYTSSMTLMLANIRNDFIEDQLNKLSIMVAENNFEAVADRLDITPEAAKQIKEMSFLSLDQNKVEEDSVLTGSPFSIELSLYDRGLFETMEPALTNYLENNRYFAKEKRIKQRQVESMISRLKGEISSIDSMKNNVSEPKGPVNGFIYGQPIDPTNLYKQSISLYKEQVQLEASLEKLDNVEVVTGFAPKLRPTGPSLRKHLAIGALVAFAIGIVVALNLESSRWKM